MFKNEIRKVYDMPDKPPLYFSTGIRIANILHARLRQKCSSLKCDLFRCNLNINLLDKFFKVNNVFLDEQEQFRVFVVFKRGISK
jgi:hypothetical protein